MGVKTQTPIQQTSTRKPIGAKARVPKHVMCKLGYL